MESDICLSVRKEGGEKKMNKGEKILYVCDPNKNTECKKSVCQILCFHTPNKEFSLDGIPHTVRELLNQKMKEKQ